MTTQFLQIRKPAPALADIIPEKRPRDAALLGIATDDGLPVYLHFGDPFPGAILIVGNPTPLLRCIARTAAQARAITQAITIFPEIWDDLRGQSVVIETDDHYLGGIARKMMSRPTPYPRWLVVIDRYNVRDVEALAQICRWGPPCGVWPIVAVDYPANVPDVIPDNNILHSFRTLVVAKNDEYILYAPKKPTGHWQARFNFFVPR